MPVEQFKEMSYLPLPILDESKEHFKLFKDVYGQDPNEKDRPSLKSTSTKDVDLDKVNRKLLSSAGRVRTALHCGECFKSRCVYSEAVLTQQEKSMVGKLESSYTCGSILCPPASLYHSTIVTRVKKPFMPRLSRTPVLQCWISTCVFALWRA